MNSFGTIFRTTLFGESHGNVIGISLDGVPSGISLCEEDFEIDLNRRKPGGKGTTPRIESDFPILTSGVFNGKTTGAPLTILFENKNTLSQDYKALRHTPRPGHADFVATKKFGGFEDYRGGGHFSGRLTVLLVAAGVVSKKVLSTIKVAAQLVEVGGETEIEKGLDKALKQQDSIGGIIECRVSGLPIGLGEPFFDSVESLISHAIFAIPAVKGIEFGSGFTAAKMLGSEHNDAIIDMAGTTQTNHAGGIVGGITNGNELTFRTVIKPTSSTPKIQQSINLDSEKVESFQIKGRHDLCIALRAPVVIEAVTALVLADLILRNQFRSNFAMDTVLREVDAIQ
jgi:chorismate synthase